MLEEKGLTLVDPFANTNAIATFRCNNGHEFTSSVSAIQANNYECFECRKPKPIFINDIKAKTTCPYYRRWRGIFGRCYSKSSKHLLIYEGVSICEEWHTLSNFKKWMQTQDWKDNHLDKDIIFPGNQIYGPDTCCFVPPEINHLFRTYKQRDLPQGVQKNTSGRYQVRIRTNLQKIVSIGTFNTIEEARVAYIEARICLLVDAINRIDDPRIKKGIEKHITLLSN